MIPQEYLPFVSTAGQCDHCGHQLVTAFHRIPDVIARFGPDLCYRFINAAVTVATGHPPSFYVGKRMAETGFPEAVAAEREAIVQAAMASGETLRHPFEYRNPAGELRYFEAMVVPMTPQEGGGALVISRDITPLREALAATSRAEQRFTQLAGQSRDVFWVALPGLTRYLYVSPALENVFGVTVSQFMDDPSMLLTLIHPDDREVLRDAIAGIADSGAVTAEYRIIQPDGSIRWLRTRALSGRDADYGAIRYGMTEDITEHKLLEMAASARQKQQQDAILREVHHRAKNTLQGVVGLLQRGQSRSLSPDAVFAQAIRQLSAVSGVFHLHASAASGQRPRFSSLVALLVDEASRERDMPIQFCDSTQQPRALQEGELVPLALACLEMLVNAAKHGLPPVRVWLEDTLHGCRLTVENAVNAESLAERGGSGLRLMQALLPPKDAVFELLTLADGRKRATLDIASVLLEMVNDEPS